jgi:hypothetical protein
MKLVKTSYEVWLFYVSLLSEKYKTGKMNYVKALWDYVQILKQQNFEYSSHIYILKNN